MDEYKPKRIEFKKFNGYSRSIGLCLTREQWGLTKDYYIYINLWYWNLTIVFFRFNTPHK